MAIYISGVSIFNNSAQLSWAQIVNKPSGLVEAILFNGASGTKYVVSYDTGSKNLIFTKVP